MKSGIFFALLPIFSLACSSATSTPTDSGPNADAAATANRDAAATGNPDAAATGNPDAAATGDPDAAATGNPDAVAAGNPDAMAMGNPDAMAMGNPDAAAMANPDAASPPINCMGTLSGAVTGTFSCNISAGYSGQDNLSAFSVTVPAPPAGVTTVSLASSITGRLMTQTYSSPNGFEEWGGAIVAGSGVSTAVYSASEGPPPVGAQTVTFTSVNVRVSMGGNDVYEVHGTARWDLVQQGGAGTVRVDLTF